ncbi:MAG: hypothetical protein MK183_03345 [Verrucomicrobiales bacterium]|nr:hypothetical protein [Verrucomicrobiales bacterium]
MNKAQLAISTLAVLASHLYSQEVQPNPPKNKYSETHRFVFYAVLEGCFESGLTQEEVDIIIPVRVDRKDRRSITANLVYTCPLCSPVFDAFRIYSDRRIFISGISKDKAFNTFGAGLSKRQKESLRAGGRECRKAIQKLISEWIERRIAIQKMEPLAERQLRRELAEMRKEGDMVLEKIKAGGLGPDLQKIYMEREGCPACAGASPMAVGK